MKNFILSLCAIGLLWYFGFRYLENNGNINLSFSEDEKEVVISAKFPNEKTDKVRDYLTEQLSSYKDFSFKNAELDANITLNDSSTFYINSSKGSLKIIMERSKNSAESYRKMKKLNDGLKEILTSN